MCVVAGEFGSARAHLEERNFRVQSSRAVLRLSLSLPSFGTLALVPRVCVCVHAHTAAPKNERFHSSWLMCSSPLCSQPDSPRVSALSFSPSFSSSRSATHTRARASLTALPVLSPPLSRFLMLSMYAREKEVEDGAREYKPEKEKYIRGGGERECEGREV